jgi:hypothetical protein
MIPFTVIMFQVLFEHVPQGTLAEEDHVVQTLGFYGKYESLGVSVQIWALRRYNDRIYAGIFRVLSNFFENLSSRS